MANVGNMQSFCEDLRASVKEVADNPSEFNFTVAVRASLYNLSCFPLNDDAAKYSSSAKLYGTVASIPDPSLINETTAAFLDALFTPVGRGAPPSKYASVRDSKH